MNPSMIYKKGIKRIYLIQNKLLFRKNEITNICIRAATWRVKCGQISEHLSQLTIHSVIFNKPDQATMRPDCVSACIDFGARLGRTDR